MKLKVFNYYNYYFVDLSVVVFVYLFSKLSGAGDAQICLLSLLGEPRRCAAWRWLMRWRQCFTLYYHSIWSCIFLLLMLYFHIKIIIIIIIVANMMMIMIVDWLGIHVMIQEWWMAICYDDVSYCSKISLVSHIVWFDFTG